MTFALPAPTRSRGERLRAGARVASLRASFATLDRVAPSRAAERALDVWCTLPANAGRRKDLRPGPGEVSRLRTTGGGDVVVESWGEGPTVCLAHGWGGWRGQLGAFVDPLVRSGHRVVAFDAPGHGDAEPGVLGMGKGNAMELIDALETVVASYGPAHGVIAHSLGCTTAAAAIRRSVRVERLALIAPNHDFVGITRDLGRLLGFTERTRALLQQAMEEFCGQPLSDFDLAPLGRDGSMPPTLVVHDLRDKETPYRVGSDLAAEWPTATLLTTDGLGHQRILADADTVAHVVGHIRGLVHAPSSIEGSAG